MRKLQEILAKYGSLFLVLLNAVLLIWNPLPFCIACEPQPPPGRHDDLAWASLLFSPFLAGCSNFSGRSTVPIALVFVLTMTQSIGGVTLTDLLRNEGPFILFAGSIVSGSLYWLGKLSRYSYRASLALLLDRPLNQTKPKS